LACRLSDKLSQCKLISKLNVINLLKMGNGHGQTEKEKIRVISNANVKCL